MEYASYLVRYLTEQNDDVIFAAWQPSDELERLKQFDVDIAYVGTGDFEGGRVSTMFKEFIGFRRVNTLASQFDVDVLHYLWSDETEIPLYLSLLSGRENGGDKIFATLFNPRYGRRTKRLFSNVFRAANGFVMSRLINSWIDGLFVHSDRIKRELTRSLGTEDSRIVSIPDPIDPDEIDLDQAEAREELSLPVDTELFLFFGGMRWDKGPDLLLSAITRLERTGSTVVFAGSEGVIGERDLEEIRSKLDNTVSIVGRFGFIDEELVNTYFTAADAVVLPYREEYAGTSGILQHAAAARRPVIATDVGEVGRLVNEYDLGIVTEEVTPEAIAEAIDRFALEELDPLGIDEYVEDHHWRTMAGKIRDAYST